MGNLGALGWLSRSHFCDLCFHEAVASPRPGCCTAASQMMGWCVTEAEHSAPGSVQPVTTPKELKNYF